MPAIDIGLGFGAALGKIEQDLVGYVAKAFGEEPGQALSAVSIARSIEQAVGIPGFYLSPQTLLGWIEAFEERTGRMILQKVSDSTPQKYLFVYGEKLAYPG